MTSGIYQIVNKENNKRYIGSSVNVEGRVWNHFTMLISNRHGNKHLQNAYNKYGHNNFEAVLIYECSEEELLYYVPNSFTPDGDGVNDTFLPTFTSGYDPYDYSLLIFNRWGQIVFESHDATKGWNATMGVDGEIVQDGTYTWKIEFKTKNAF